MYAKSYYIKRTCNGGTVIDTASWKDLGSYSRFGSFSGPDTYTVYGNLSKRIAEKLATEEDAIDAILKHRGF